MWAQKQGFVHETTVVATHGTGTDKLILGFTPLAATTAFFVATWALPVLLLVPTQQMQLLTLRLGVRGGSASQP